MKFYWTLLKLAKYAPNYHTAIVMQSTADMWLEEQAGLIPYLNAFGNQFLPSYWEDVPEIDECLEEARFYLSSSELRRIYTACVEYNSRP